MQVERFDRNIEADEFQPGMVRTAGAGAQQAAEVAGTVAAGAFQMQRIQNEVKSTSWLTDASVKLQQSQLDIQEKLQEKYRDNPAGFQEEADKMLYSAIDGLGKTAPTRDAQQAWAKMSASLRVQSTESWKGWEKKATTEKYATDLDTNLQAISGLAYRDPENWQKYVNQSDMAMVGAEKLLSASVLAKVKQQNREAIGVAAFDGRFKSDPYAARDMMDSGSLDALLPPTKIAQLRERAQNEVERLERQAKQEQRLNAIEIRGRATDVEDALRSGVDVPLDDELLSGLTDEEKGQWNKRFKIASEYGRDVSAIAYASPEETAELLQQRQAQLAGAGNTPAAGVAKPKDAAALQPGVAPAQDGTAPGTVDPAQESMDLEGFKARSKDLGQLLTVVNQRNAAIQADPASYAAGGPNMQPAVAQMQAAIQSQDPEKIATAQQGYTARLVAEQQRLGVRPEAIRYISKTEASRQVSNYMAAQDNQARMDMIKALQGTYGRYWPSVAFSMKEAGMPAGFTLLGDLNMDSPMARRLVQATTETKEIKQILGDGGAGKVNKAVQGQLSALRNTMANQPGGVGSFNDISAGINLLAQSMVAKDGMDPDAAAQAAARVITDQYDFRSTYRIPKIDAQRRAVDSGLVEKNLDFARRNMKEDEVDQPANTLGYRFGVFKRSVGDALHGSTYWVTNHDESGFNLVWETGQPVTKGNKPVQLLLQDLNQVNPEAEKNQTFEESLKNRNFLRSMS